MGWHIDLTGNCRACNTKLVIADAGSVKSIPYFYCRTCKAEVTQDGRKLDETEEKVDATYKEEFPFWGVVTL